MNIAIRRRRASSGRRSQNIATKPWTIMEVCGGQTHTIVKYGIDELLPPGIELVHGPGCPVCVTPLEMIDKAHRDRLAAGSDLLLVRRHAPRARQRRRPASPSRRRAATCGSSIRRSMPEDRRSRIPTAASSSSRSASRRRRRPTPWPSGRPSAGGSRTSACSSRTCWCRRR